jgi:hypothetical protein
LLPLLQVLKPAIELADAGFAVSPITAYHWGKSAYAIRKQGCTEAAVGALLQADGQTPVAGQRWSNKHMAATLQRVAQLGAREGEQRFDYLPPVQWNVHQSGASLCGAGRAMRPMQTGIRHTVCTLQQ